MTELTDYNDGDTLPAADLNNDNLLMIPIGSVISWLKDYANTPALPDEFVECNGQVLSDADSVYDGQTIPDLNGPADTGTKGMFLRGHSSSGVTETSQNLEHTHTVPLVRDSVSGPSSTYATDSTADAVNNDLESESSGGNEARPHNYSVVWIIRIK